MLYNNENEKIEILKSCSEKCKEIESSLNLKEGSVSIMFSDSKESENDQNGELTILYIKQPDLISAISILDSMALGKLFSCGRLCYDAMVLKTYGDFDKVESVNELKLGFIGKLPFAIKINQTEIKKK